jgi:DNA replication licensing factor MCM2
LRFATQDVPLDLDIEEVKGRLTEWIAQEQVAAEIKRRFRQFLRNYPNDNPNGQAAPGGGRQPEMYMERIRAMCKGGWHRTTGHSNHQRDQDH